MADVSGARLIGVDVGGTRIKAGLVDPQSGAVLRDAVTPVGASRDADAIVAQLAALCREIDPDSTAPVGIAAAGVIDADAGIVRESPNFPAWRDFELGHALAAATGRSVVLENDANAVVWGEAVVGAARGESTLAGYALGTGVGGALVLGGRLWRGVRGMAGELGHVTVVREGRPCGCGNRGCLEQYAGAVGLVQTLREAGGALGALAEDPAQAAARLAERARAGDSEAQAIFADAGRHLGLAAASLIHTLDLQVFVLCGGIGQGAFDLVAPAMEAEIHARTFRSMARGVTLRPGQLDARAGIVGAALLANQAKGQA